jgi:hypothetical protein
MDGIGLILCCPSVWPIPSLNIYGLWPQACFQLSLSTIPCSVRPKAGCRASRHAQFPNNVE